GHSTGHSPAIAQGMTGNSSSSSSSLKEIHREGNGSQLPTDLGTSSKPNAKKKPVLSPLPDEFTISNSLWEWTVKKGYSRELVEREFDTFCNDRVSKG